MFILPQNQELIKQHCLISEPDDIIKGAVEGQVSLFTLDKLQHVDVNECKCPGGLRLIHLAVHYGQLEVVRLLIAAGADVDLEGPGTITVKHHASGTDMVVKTPVFTALHQATLKGDIDMVEVILDAGADVNKPNGRGKTPLYYAIVNGCCGLVQMLLLRGSIHSTTDPGIIPPSEDTHTTLYPLHLAATMGHTSIVQLFLDRGYAIDTMNDSNETALSCAARKGIVSSVEFLLQNGADIKLISIEEYHSPTIVRVLAKAGANVHGPEGNEDPLYDAIFRGDLSTVKVLVDAGARMDVPDSQRGFLPLTKAVRCQSTEMVEYFLKQNLDPNECSVIENGEEDRETALSVAVNDSNVEILNLLLEYGADVNLCSENGNTPLFAAAYSGRQDIAVELLIKAGAHVNHANAYSSTPLHQAVWGGSIEKVKILIQYGADVNAKDNDGLTPLHVSAVVGKEDLVRYLLPAEASINNVSIQGETALHLAIDFDNLEIVKILMTMGARGDIGDSTNTIPLHLAAVRGLPHMAEYLVLKSKCVINYSDIFGATPLHLATFNGHETTVQVLLDNGADTNLTYKGELPLHIAQRCGYNSLVQLFDSSHPVLNRFVSLDTFLESVIETTGIGKVADTDPDVKIINETVESYMREVLARVAHLDPRFKGNVFLRGSVPENCKVGMPDECDIMMSLTCFTTGFEVVEDVSVLPQYAKLKIIDAETKTLWPEMMAEQGNSYLLPGTLKQILMDNIGDVLLQDDFRPPSGIYCFKNDFPYNTVRQCVVDETRSGFKMIFYWWNGCYKGMKITVDIIIAFPMQHSPTSLNKKIPSNNIEQPLCYLIPKTGAVLNKYLWLVVAANIEKEKMLALPEEIKLLYIKAKVLLIQAVPLVGIANKVLPVPSYYLKTSFFFELERFPVYTDWHGSKHLDRMESIFERLDVWLQNNETVPSFFIEGGFIKRQYDMYVHIETMLDMVSNILEFLKKHKSKAVNDCPCDLRNTLSINVS